MQKTFFQNFPSVISIQKFSIIDFFGFLKNNFRNFDFFLGSGDGDTGGSTVGALLLAVFQGVETSGMIIL